MEEKEIEEKEENQLKSAGKRKDITKKLVGTGIFSALAFVVSLLEFPIFPSADFLKLDFSLVFVSLSGFAFGPIFGIATCLIKELIRFSYSSTGGIGELANFIVALSFIIIPTLVYRFKKGIPVVIITLSIGCVFMMGTAMLTNRFIMFPLYMGEGAQAVFNSVWYFILLFNLIKSVTISVLVFLVYKRLSNVIKRI